MSLFDSLKDAAAKLVSESPIGRNLGPLVKEAVLKLEGTSADVLGNVDLFRAKLSDPSYNRLPVGLQQWITPDYWHRFLNGVKDSVFRVEAGHIRIQEEFKTAAQEFVNRLIHGQKAAEKKSNSNETP